MSAPTPMRMFPLGSVLFPGGVVPLQIFEQRYLTMIHEALAGDEEFGIVLIERGSAESVDTVRSDLGTVARIVRHETLEDGRMVILGVGTRRIEVVQWLDDDPYPRAMVETLPNAAARGDLAAPIQRVARLWRRIQALASEVGYDVEITELDLSYDQDLAVWELCSAAQLGPFDRQQLLGVGDPELRLTTLEQGLLQVAADLETRLGIG